MIFGNKFDIIYIKKNFFFYLNLLSNGQYNKL